MTRRDQRTPRAEPAASPQAERQCVRPELVAVIAVALAYVVVQYLFLRPPFPSDSIMYLHLAADYPAEASHWTLRIGLIYPVRAAVTVFGFSEAAYYVVPALSGLTLVLVTYWVGQQLFDWLAGALAALLMMTSPFFLEWSSMIVPDTLSAALFGAAIGLLLQVLRRDPHNDGRMMRVWPFLAVGLLLGWAYLAREYIVFLFPLVPLLFILYKKDLRFLIPIAMSAAGLFLTEMLIHGLVFGEPLARIMTVLGHDEKAGAAALLAAYGEGATRLDVLLRLPRVLQQYAIGHFLIYGAISIAVITVLTRTRRSLILITWIALLWIHIILLAGLIDPQSPLIRENHLRYWFLIFPAAYLVVVAVPYELAARLTGHSWADTIRIVVLVCTGVFLAIVNIAGVRDTHDSLMYREQGATQWMEVRHWLEQHGDTVDTVWIDSRMALVFPLYTRSYWGGTRIWDGDVRIFDTDGAFMPPGEVRSGAIVLHQLGENYLRNHQSLELPPYLAEPGVGWTTDVRRADSSLVIHRYVGSGS